MNALLVDVGNTRVKWRIVDLSTPARPAARTAIESLPTSAIDDVATSWRALRGVPLGAALYSNVASRRIDAALTAAIEATWGEIPVQRVRPAARRCGVVNGYRDPTQLGSDRWLALIAAHALRPDGSQLVCTFGTATTIDLLVRTGDGARFVGGMILPGFDVMRASLSTSTARLAPGVRDRAADTADFAVDTDGAIASGVLGAQVGAVESAIRAARARLGRRNDADTLACLLAGGHASQVLPRLAGLDVPVRIESELVLQGLAVLAADDASEPSLSITLERTGSPCARCS